MPISMPDSIKPLSLPAGYPAYLGYVDGEWPTAAGLRAAHPQAHVLSLTVLGESLEADGVDCEPGNVNAAGAAGWVKRKLASAPASRPVAYADLESPGYSMAEVIAALLNLGISRVKYRVLTAHYTGVAHICSPSTCGTAFQADGTQWTSKYPGIGGEDIDMSLLDDEFFGAAAPAPTWVFAPVRELSARPGHTSVSLAWSAPAGTEPAPVDHYQVTIRKDGQDIPTYPRDVPRAAGVQVWQGGSLPPGTVLEAFVRAVTADVNGHASPWATVTFTTGHA